MTFKNKDQWLEEYSEFAKIDAATNAVPENVFKALRERLFPNPWFVFGKVAILHGVVGFLSLVVCNQFGLNPFNTEQSLTDLFMRAVGHNLCMLLCGTFFLGSTYLFANLLLTLEELESVQRHSWTHAGSIGMASLGVFYFFGAELVATFAFLWIIGALLGAYLSIEGSYLLRRNMI